ncbi:MAG: mechanosensitive ion channel family protein [Actinomycetota bacterium]|nr:mechanosensitive ion channel family protein [Actinomycetota bacterium]
MRDLVKDITLVEFLRTSFKVVLILVVAMLLARLGSRFVARSIRSIATRSPLREAGPRSEQRATTLAAVAVSLIRIVVWTMAGLVVLGVLGVNLGPFLAGASIVGVALGFGAQSLVKDFLSGFFILVEDQYAVGDVITIADQTGTVEEIDLRTTRIRAVDGTVWFVPNGEIRKVGNSAKDWGRAIVDVVVPRKADLAAATAVIEEEAAAVAADPAWSDSVLEPPEILGVDAMGVDNITVRVSTKTTPAQRTPLARAMRSRISHRLQRDGVVAEATIPEPEPQEPTSSS